MKFKTSITILLMHLVALTSCVEVMDDPAEAVGYLAPISLSLDASVTDLVESKALSLPEIQKPDVDAIMGEIHFVVTDKNGKEHYNGKGPWTENLIMPVGKYTVKASYGTNDFDKVYFEGTSSSNAIIDPYEQEKPNVTLCVGNSLVAVTLSSDFAQHYTPESVTLTSGDESITGNKDTYYFVPSGKALSVKVTGKSAAGISKTVEYTNVLTPAAKSAYNVECGVTSTNVPSITMQKDLSAGAFQELLYFPAATVSNISSANAAKLTYQIKGGAYSVWTDISVSDATIGGNAYKLITGLSIDTEYAVRARVGSVYSNESNSFKTVLFSNCISITSASAVHKKNSSNELSGTSVSATVNVSLPSIIAEIASVSASATFKNSSNVQRASGSASLPNSGSTTFTLTNASGWPYIPKGSGHTLSMTVNCYVGNETYTALPSKTGISVPAPDFFVTLSEGAYTSYDRYAGTNGITKLIDSETDNTAANNLDAATLYNIPIKWGISTELMANANYTKKLSILTNGKERKSYSVTSEYTNNYLTEQTISGLDKDSHVLSAQVTFDDTTITAANTPTHYITGLPYSTSLNKNTTGWSSFNNVETDSDYFIFNTDEASVLSPQFTIPAQVDVSVTLAMYAYHTNATADYDPTVYVSGASKAVSKTGASQTVDSSINLVGTAGCDNYSFSTSMSRTNSYICIYVYGKKNTGWLSAPDYPEFFIDKFVLKYR